MARTKQHPGTIEERGDSVRVILYSEGKRHSFTLPGATLADAREFAHRKNEELQEIAKRRALGLPGPMRFSHLLEKFEAERLPLLAPGTQATYRSAAKRFHEYFVDGELRDPTADNIRRAHVKGYLIWRRTRRRGGGVASARTLAKDRTILHAIFSFAEELELREGNPVAKVKPPKAEKRDPVLLNPDQYEALLAAARERDPILYTYVLVLGETGARCISEAMRLKFEDVDLDGGFLFIPSRAGEHRTKSGAGRWVPLTPRLKEALREHFAAYRLATYRGRRSPYLFHHTRTRRNVKAGERIKSFRTPLAHAIAAADLPGSFRAHDLRHRRVTTWLAEGKSPALVKEAMGHSAMQTTMGYTHLSREHLKALVEEPAGRERLKELGS